MAPGGPTQAEFSQITYLTSLLTVGFQRRHMTWLWWRSPESPYASGGWCGRRRPGGKWGDLFRPKASVALYLLARPLYPYHLAGMPPEVHYSCGTGDQRL